MSFDLFAGPLFDSCLSTFGEVVSYLPKSGEAFYPVGIFIRDYQIVQESGFDSVVSTAKSSLEVHENDFKKAPALGDQISIRGSLYRVVEIQPNHEGQIKLILKVKT